MPILHTFGRIYYREQGRTFSLLAQLECQPFAFPEYGGRKKQ